MTTLLLERSVLLDEYFEGEARCQLDGTLFAGRPDAPGGLTLDEFITGVWESLALRGTVNCPVCESSMALGSSAHRSDAPTGVCLSCGSRLS